MSTAQSNLGKFEFLASNLEKDQDIITAWVKECLILEGVKEQMLDNIKRKFIQHKSHVELTYTASKYQVTIRQSHKSERFDVNFEIFSKGAKRYVKHRKQGPACITVWMCDGTVIYAAHRTQGRRRIFPSPEVEYYSHAGNKVLRFDFTRERHPLKLILQETVTGEFYKLHFVKSDLYSDSIELQYLSELVYGDVIEYLLKRYNGSVVEFLLHPDKAIREMVEKSLESK